MYMYMVLDNHQDLVMTHKVPSSSVYLSVFVRLFCWFYVSTWVAWGRG